MGVLTENYWQFVNKTVICRYFFQSIITQCFSQLPFLKLKSGSNNYLFISEVFVSYLLSSLFLRWLMRWRCYRVQITIGTAAWSTLSLSHPESSYRDSGPRKPVTRLRLRYQSQETELRPRADILWTININKHWHQTHHSQTLQMLHLWVWSFLSAWKLKT